MCPSGRVPTAVVVTLKEGRTELTGNIDDERPTSPDRTWWTSSISLGLLMCPMWSKAFKRELMIIRYIKRMCTVYIYRWMYISMFVCVGGWATTSISCPFRISVGHPLEFFQLENRLSTPTSLAALLHTQTNKPKVNASEIKRRIKR